MGKKRITALGSTNEDEQKAKRAIQLEQKKLREGKTAKAPGLKGGQRVVDTTAETLAEYETIQQKQAAAAPDAETVPVKASTKKRRLRSTAYKQAKLKIDSDRTYSLSEALNLLKEVSLTKFDPTVELHLILKSGSFNQNVELPFSTGKTKRIAVADDQIMAQIEAGKIDFDVLFASPAQMGKLVKFAKVLGPKGLMPNPKNGTVVADPEAAAKKVAGQISVSLKTEKSAPVIHTIIGKLSQKPAELTKNIETIFAALPQNQLKKAVIKSTMSPAIKFTL
jgi:large subunit ribosomal protein L1